MKVTFTPIHAIITLVVLMVGLVACDTETEPGTQLPDIQGPALIMFYTDG